MPVTAQTSLWRNRDYVLLWSGQLISVMGNRISEISLPLLILSVTHSTVQAGTVAALLGLPYLLFGLPAGVLVDRWNRKYTMLGCEAVSAVATATIPVGLWTGRFSMLQLYVVALATGTAFVFFNVAEIASLPSVVGESQLPAAVSQQQAGFSAGGVAGPPIAGLLFHLARPLPFLADAISYAVSFVSLLAIRVPLGGSPHSTDTSLRREFLEGMRWVWNHRTIRGLTLLTASGNLLTGGFTLLIILLAQQHHASTATIGGVFAFASVAALLGTVLAPRVLTRFSVGQVTTFFFWFSAALYPLYLLAPNVLFIALINGAAFLAGPAYNVAIISYRLSCVPEHLQGRVNSSVRVLALGAAPLGAGLAGVILQVAGVAAMVWILGVGTALLALAATLTPSIRSAPQVSLATMA